MVRMPQCPDWWALAPLARERLLDKARGRERSFVAGKASNDLHAQRKSGRIG
jgi:hypothetical protein